MTGAFNPFVNGRVRCPACHRDRPISDLMGEYDPGSDFFTIRGIRCSATGCRYHYPESLAGLVRWGSQFPKPGKIPQELKDPVCPFCNKVVIEIPDGPFGVKENRRFHYVRCPASPLVFRMEVI